MIQFNRYRLPDEPADFHQRFCYFVDKLKTEINGDLKVSMDMLRDLGRHHPLNERLPAVAARLFFWGKMAWKDVVKFLPSALPQAFFYKQEIAGCLGHENSWRRYGVDEDGWNLYQGFSSGIRSDCLQPGNDVVVYQPRSSGFFSVIENMVAAAITYRIEGKRMVVDLSGNWWAYDEPFDDIFKGLFDFTRDDDWPRADWDCFRNRWLQATDGTASLFCQLKTNWYAQIHSQLSKFAPSVQSVGPSGVMFVRGGDKLQKETILAPSSLYLGELKWMARRCQTRYVLSDDMVLGDKISGLDSGVQNASQRVHGGYYHHPGRKISCMNIIGNYLSMAKAKENMSCPSANIVNAANWSRSDSENYSISNPVYRYLLI